MATYSKDFIVKNGLQVGGHILPDDDETYDLGSSTKKFRDLYLSAGTIYLGDLVLKDNGDGTMATFEADGVTAASVQANAVDIDYDNSTSGMTATHVKGALDELMAAVEAIDTAGELAYDNSTSGLTATTVKGAIDEVVAEQEGNTKTLLASYDGNIIPDADITYDLGSPTKQWRDVYVGPGSLYLNGTKVLEDDSGTLKFNADPNQAMTISTTGTAAITVSGGNALNFQTSEANADIALNPTGDIELNADVVIGAGQALTTSNGSALTVNSNLDLGSNTVTAATFYGNLTGNISASSGTTTMNNLVVDGNLTVGGTTTTVNTETINLADNIITLNSNAVGSASQNAGIEIERGDDTNVTLRWNETTDTWEVTEDGANYKAIVLAGDSVTANAATATALETARDLSLTGDATATLSGFDGSANVSAAITLANSGVTAASYGSASQVPVITVDAKGRITSASTTAVAGVSSTAYNSTTGVLTINTSDGGSFTEDLGVGTGDSPTFANVTASLTGNASTATKLATARTIGGVSFDGSANINLPGVNAAGNQDTSGNAATATALATARTIGLSGDVSGSTTFDGTGNVTITATVADDSHNHTIANVDGLQTALNAAETDAVTTANAYTDTREAAITTAYQTYADQAEVDAKSYADTQIANLVDSAPTTLDTLNELAAALGDDANFSTTVSNQIGTKLDASHDMTLTLSGDASGSATFTNMGNATLTVAVANDSHTHDGRYYTETELSANGTGNTTSGAYKIGTYDEFGNSNSTNVQDVLDDLDAAISTALGKDPTLTINGDASGSATFTNLGNATLTLTIADDSHNHTIANVDGLQTALNAGFVSASASNDTITFTTAGGTTSSVSISDATLSTEQVQDIVGAMVSGNTESDISVTYNDSTGKLNFSVTGGGSVDTATENTFTAIQTFSAGFKSGNPFSYVKNVVDSNTTLTGISGYEIQGASSIIEIANGATLTISSGTTVAI